ncbi:DUF3892 domain-containing protein [Hoeflea sp.]|uniref:DUF3892 domain-containing protein n=1 Tax=Hoeflea sp. TaxID=1940281 RepID=UPI003BB1E940
MAKRAQIKCINKNDRYNPYERITHVGGHVTSQWKITLDDAIARIENGEWEFFVGGGGLLTPEVNVIVAESPHGNKYLKTEADDREPNNLLSLPECP